MKSAVSVINLILVLACAPRILTLANKPNNLSIMFNSNNSAPVSSGTKNKGNIISSFK